MPIRQAIYGVAAKIVRALLLAHADKGELIFGSPEMPHNVAGLAVNLFDPVGRAHDEMAVGVLEDAIDVKGGNDCGGGIHPLARERVVVPRAPLEDDISLRVKLLKNRAG